MWKALGLCFLIALILIGCSRTWNYTELEEFSVDTNSPPALDCRECHQREYDSWKATKHANSSHMQAIPLDQLQGCGACHGNLTSHKNEPATNVPPDLPELGKAEQNVVCGKCHYNKELLGKKAINPHDKHGLFMSVGFEGKKRQISCLDCHSGHKGKGDMLHGIRAHTCFKCHKEAIVTMGVFQLPNYLSAGKVCLGCHPPHGGTFVGKSARMITGALLTCVICHPTGL